MKPVYFFKRFIIAGFLLMAGNVHGQMVGADIFLGGKYVEVGIANNGWYGSDSVAPVGYHPHCSGCTNPNGLGFVADPAMDGWATGTPAYMGDYFKPGSPFEGWEIQVKGGKRAMAFNPTASFAGGMSGTGSTVSYTTSGTTVSGTWVGNYDSLQVTQVTTLDTTQLYFTINITLTNFSTTPVDSVYYFRTLDPDNDETWSGNYSTNNKIEHQSTDTTVVSATGTVYPGISFLALGTTDTNSTALVYQSWPNPPTRDISTMYNQTYSDPYTLYAQGSFHDSVDVAIGLITFVPHLSTVDSSADSTWRTTSTYYTKHPLNKASFTYFYAFSPAAMDSAIAKLHMLSPITLSITNVNNNEAVQVFPNPSRDIVNISGLAASDKVSLYDMLGRSAEMNWTVTHDGMNTFRYGNVPSGAYILIVTDAQGNIRSRTPVRKM